MIKIGLMSDTHSHLETQIFEYFDCCDEIWHAGDIGSIGLLEELESFKPVRAVYGNIDNHIIRAACPLNQQFELEGINVFMTHIGGYPQRYTARVKKIIEETSPDLYICGHSHILKIMPDESNRLLHINPGACGVHGFHKEKTIVRFSIDKGRIRDLEVINLGKRGAIPQ